MSYILEALKKLEQKRQQEESLHSLTLSGTPGAKAKKRPLWPYLVIAALILNAGVMIWWLGFRGENKKELSAGAPSTRVSVKPAPGAAPAGEPIRSSSIKKEEAADKTPQPATRSKAKEGRKASPPQAEKMPVSEPVTTAPPAPAKKEVPRSDRVFNLNELPADLKSTLPSFKVSAHVYSPDPPTRMIRVNDMILHEGQDLMAGLKVEEILPNGVIFRGQGYRFRVGIQ